MRRVYFIVCICLLLAAALPAAADQDMPNPSFYSAGDMICELPPFWIANYIEVQEYLKKYPDFQCEHYATVLDSGNFDQIVCTSVNNERTKDVIINFYFSGDHAGMTGLQEVVFTIGAGNTRDIQEALEYFWLPNAFPWHFDSDGFYNNMTSLIFHTGDSVLRFDLPDFNTGEEHFVTVDLWDINASRMGVG